MNYRVVMILLIAACISAPVLAQVPGGYVERKVNDPEVVAAAKFALKEVREKKIFGDRILRAASQVVAGTNYRLDLQVIDKSGEKPVKRQAQAIVYQDLKQKYKLTSWKWKKK